MNQIIFNNKLIQNFYYIIIFINLKANRFMDS
jgi:hypothetical protein